MNTKFIIVLLSVLLGVSTLVYKASVESSRKVVTVRELVDGKKDRPRIRLGARVHGNSIDYKTDPKFLLEFLVRDIESPEIETAKTIEVTYNGIKPDTLQPGRDVILEGNYKKGVFYASSLLTQCPSKYEPPSMSEKATG